MTTSIESAFQQFDANIRPSVEQMAAAHKAEARVSRLVSATKGVEACLPVGSMVRGTAVRRYSDLDLLAIFAVRDREAVPVRPGELLTVLANQLRLDLADTAVDVGSVAVSLDLSSWPSVDIIPALSDSNVKSGEKVYRIPAENDLLWQAYSPQSRDALVAERERELGPRLKSAIRMTKWWSYINGQVLASFEIEQLVCRAFEHSIPPYPMAVTQIFAVAAKGQVDGELLAVTRDRSIQALDTAASLSEAALRAGQSNTSSEKRRAIGHWRGLFGDEFPDIFG